jgi:hypothetical protein
MKNNICYRKCSIEMKFSCANCCFKHHFKSNMQNTIPSNFSLKDSKIQNNFSTIMLGRCQNLTGKWSQLPINIPFGIMPKLSCFLLVSSIISEGWILDILMNNMKRVINKVTKYKLSCFVQILGFLYREYISNFSIFFTHTQ